MSYQSVLLNGLLNSDVKQLAQVYVTWNDSNIINQVSKKVKSIGESKGFIERELKKSIQVCEIENRANPEKLAGKLVAQFSDHCGIACSTYSTPVDLDRACLDLEEAAIRILKETSKNKFKGNSTDAMIAYVIKDLLSQIEKDYSKADANKQRELVSNLLDSMKSMSPQEQEMLKKKLGVNQLSEEVVRKALTQGGLAVAFSSLISMGGFTSYIVAVKVVAAVTAFVGITLPFAFYTTLTSFIAAIANPFLFVPVLLGGGAFMVGRANKKIKNALLPSLITQLILNTESLGKPLNVKEVIANLSPYA